VIKVSEWASEALMRSTAVDAGLKGVESSRSTRTRRLLRCATPTIKMSDRTPSSPRARRGADPEKGYGAGPRKAATRIKEALKGADMVFVTAGRRAAAPVPAPCPGER